MVASATSCPDLSVFSTYYSGIATGEEGSGLLAGSVDIQASKTCLHSANLYSSDITFHQRKRLFHSERLDYCNYSAYQSYNAQDKGQCRRANQRVGHQHQAKQDAKRTQDACAPTTALKRLNQANHADDNPLNAQNKNQCGWQQNRAPKGMLQDENAGNDP
jgi:predicted amino acid racemase